MPRIAYITSTFPDYKKCGTGIYAGYMTQALAEQGHDVHVVTTSIPEIKSSLGKVNVHKIIQKWGMTDLPALMRFFFQVKPEIIHINHPTMIAGAKSKFLVNFIPEINRYTWRLPLVTTLHEFQHVSLLGKLKLLPLIVASDAITVTNKRYEERLKKYLPEAWHHRIQVVNIGAQFDAHLPNSNKNEQRARWGLSPDDQVIGFVGFITPPKGFHHLIEAVAPLMRKNPKLKLLALSSWNLSAPAYRQKILTQIEKEQITGQVVFSGYLEDEDLWASLSAIDLVTFPFEHPVEERSSGPLRQVLFKGLPTLVYAENLNYDEFGFQHAKNIWFTKLKDIKQLRQDIEYLLNSPEIRKTLSEGALNLRSSFSFDAVSNDMSRIYTKLLSREQPSQRL